MTIVHGLDQVPVHTTVAIAGGGPSGTYLALRLAAAGIEVHLITTSDLDISLLVRSENEDAAYDALRRAYEL